MANCEQSCAAVFPEDNRRQSRQWAEPVFHVLVVIAALIGSFALVQLLHRFESGAEFSTARHLYLSALSVAIPAVPTALFRLYQVLRREEPRFPVWLVYTVYWLGNAAIALIEVFLRR
jgi:hypothetical protein